MSQSSSGSLNLWSLIGRGWRMTAFSFRVRAGSIPLYWETRAIGVISCLKLKHICEICFLFQSPLAIRLLCVNVWKKINVVFSQGCYCWNVPRVFPGEWNNLTPLVMTCRYHRQTWKDLTEEHPDMLENAKNMQAIHLAFVTYACQGQRRETGKIWYSSICVCPNIDFMLVYVTDVNMSKYHGKYSSVLCFPQFVIFWRLAILLLIGNTHPQKES